MIKQTHPLRLNIGFIIHEEIGYSREFEFDFSELHIPPDLDLEKISGSATFNRTPQGLLAHINFSGQVQAECSRCLDDVDLPIVTDFTELFAFDEGSVSESGLLVPDSGVIDLGPLLRDYFLLEIPINPICKPDCLGLCPICGKNRNETDCEHLEDDIDPRFSGLKDLLNNDN